VLQRHKEKKEMKSGNSDHAGVFIIQILQKIRTYFAYRLYVYEMCVKKSTTLK